jgi:hypothetical protein
MVRVLQMMMNTLQLLKAIYKGRSVGSWNEGINDYAIRTEQRNSHLLSS